MKLNKSCLQNRAEWEAKGYHLPQYDHDNMVTETKARPFWVHFGAGNLFRAFHARAVEDMLNSGVLDRGIIAVEGFDYEIIDKQYAPHDNFSIAATLKADGSVEKTVVGSIAEAIPLDSENPIYFERLKEIFAQDSLQLATFTITEKGYRIVNEDGQPIDAIASDLHAGPKKPVSYMGKVAALLYARYLSGKKPIAMVSTDNCSHNGDRLYTAIAAFAKAWEADGTVMDGFADYIESDLVSFPWTMIDKITPRPDPSVEAILTQDGVEDLKPSITSKNTYTALFVNAEETEYLVIEDDFPNGRPMLEKGGLMFTDRETVDKVERMKVCTCLNPLHTCLAIFGCLLGYKKISDEMKDPELKSLVELVGYTEGLPVVVDPEILNPKVFLDTVLQVRIPNPFMPDTPQRIATDTSQKLAIRFGETIKSYADSDTLDISDLKMIPLVLAGWLRYLMGVDDDGVSFELSPDPVLDLLCPILSGIKPGQNTGVEEVIRPILKSTTIFGVDLYEVGLADKVCQYFRGMIAGVGAVRETLKKNVS